MFDKKQKICVKPIDLVTNDGLYDQNVFYTVKIVFCLSSIKASYEWGRKKIKLNHLLFMDDIKKSAML